MKINLTSARQFRAALLGTWLLVGAHVGHAAPLLPKSPVFTNGVLAWDCLITGERGERGIAFLTFSYSPDGYGNYTFDMRQIHTKVPASMPKVTVTVTNTPTDPRNGSTGSRGDSDAGDSGSTTATNLANAASQTATTNIFGYVEPHGSWGFDYKGRILGFYVELVLDQPAQGTNPPTYLTNAVSFIGTVTPNKRFTALYSSSIGGTGKYSGIPLKTVTNKVNGSDFSGPWTGEEISGKLDTVELFSFYASGFPNLYDIIGDGPGYTLDWPSYGGGVLSPGFASKCMVSCQKKIAFTNYKFVNETNSDYLLRATYGDLKNTSKILGANTKGLLEGSNVVYNTYFVPFVPYP